MNWIFDMFSDKDGIEKEAELTNRDKEWARKVQSNDWVADVMSIDEAALAKEEVEKQALDEVAKGVKKEPVDVVGLIMAFEQGDLDNAGILQLFSELIRTGQAWSLQGSYGRAAKSLIDQGYIDETGNILKEVPQSASDESMEEEAGYSATMEEQDPDYTRRASKVSAIKKIAAYEKGDTREETIEKDYELKVKGLSDYNLAEMLSEYESMGKGITTLSHNEYKEDALKSVKSGRDAAEKKLIKFLGDHTVLDWKKAFKEMEDSEVKHAAEKDLYSEWKEGKMAWESKTKFEATSEEEKIKQMDGVGAEEEKKAVGDEKLLDEQRREASLKKEADKTEFVKCPNCDSKTARKVGDKITCVTCDYGMEKKEASLKVKAATPAEMVEKKVEKLIKDKIEEAFAVAPVTDPAAFPADPLMVGENTPEDKLLDEMKVPHLEPGETPESEVKEWAGEKKEDKKEEPKVEDKKEDKKEEPKEASLKTAEALKCPHCGHSESVTPAHDNKLNKCDSCGWAFDNESSPNYAEPEEKEAAPAAPATTPPAPGVTPVDAPSNERGYHGWRNYFSWLASVWLESDREMNEQVLEAARSSSDIADLAQRIEEIVSANEPDLGASLFADIVSSGLRDIDWSAIARHYEEDMTGTASEFEEEPAAAPAPEVPAKPEASMAEIAPQSSKKDVLTKIAEIPSPWKVVKNDRGEEIIARVAPAATSKESKEKEKELGVKSQDLI